MDWIFGLFNSIGGFLSNAFAYLATIVSWLMAAVVFLANAVIALATFISNALRSLGKFLQNLWDNVIKRTIGGVWNWLQQAQQWLEDKLGPIIDFLKQARKWWDKYYNQYVLPMMNMIQRVRRFLLILRLLHIHFADKLDKWLQTYEMDVNKIFLGVHGALTQLIDWVSLAANPFGLGRMVLVSVTGRRTVAAIVRAATGLPIGHFFPSNSSKAFAFERQPMSVHDYESEDTNPPASQILFPLLDFLGTGEYDDQVGATDQDIDAVEPTPWGGELLSSFLTSEQFLAGFDADSLSLTALLEDQAGLLFTAGTGAANSLTAGWK